MAIDWAEWQNLTKEEYQKKWNRLDHKEKEEYLYEYIAIDGPITFHNTAPGQTLEVTFWARANNQTYFATYCPKTDIFEFLLHGKLIDLGDKKVIIKRKLLEAIGKEYGRS